MSTEQSIDPALIEQTKQQIRTIVAEIAQLARGDMALREFYGEFLSRIVSALAAAGGAVWTVGEDGTVDLEYQVNLRASGITESEEHLVQHNRLLAQVCKTGEPALVQPHSGDGGEDAPGNPTPHLLVLAPLRTDQRVEGIVEIFQRAGADVKAQRGYLRFLLQMCDLATDFLKTRQLRHFSDRQTLWNQLEQFTRSAHLSLDPRLAAYTIANEGRRLIGCDRVSVAIRQGRKCKVKAVSGQDVLDNRSTTVRLLEGLATAVVAAGEPLMYTGDTTDLAPQVEEAVQAYVDESHSKFVTVLPLRRPSHEPDEREPGETIGALIVEQIEDSRMREGAQQRIQVVSEHSATALSNALTHNSLFLMPLWRLLGKTRVVVSARALPKTIAIAGVVLALVAAAVFIPADFTIEARGTLQPAKRRDVFAGIDGTIQKVLVHHDDEVTEGQLLAEMDNTELDVALNKAIGDRDTALAELSAIARQRTAQNPSARPDPRVDSNAESTALKAQEAAAREKLNTAKNELALLTAKKERLKVHSPIAGRITTWDVERILLGRTVQPQDALMTVADPKSEWEVELYMPEDDMGHIVEAQREQGRELEVSYYLANSPSVDHQGKITEVHLAAEVRGDQGNTVLVRVAIDKSDLDYPSQGADATAKVYCGRRSLGYVWLHDVIDFIHAQLFRL